MPARHHHYLPQFYLRGFTKSGSKKSRLHVIDIVDNRAYETNPRNIGGKRDFNRVDLPDLDPTALESALSVFETDVARVLRWIDENERFPDNDNDYTVLMTFVAILGARNPQIRNTFANFQTELLKRMSDDAVSSPEVWESHVQRLREEGIDVPDDVTYDYMKRFVDEDRYTISFPHGYHATLEFLGVETILPYLWERGWLLCIADADAGDFICSDRPLCIAPSIPGLRNLGFGVRHTDVTVPLSRRIAILGTFERRSNFVLQTSSPLVAAFNGHTLSMAERIVFSARREFHFISKGAIRHSSSLLRSS